MTPKKVIVGIGNPDKKYAKTKHNVGWMILDELARRFKCDFGRTHNYMFAKFHINGDEVYLVKPLTYVNNSGEIIPHIQNLAANFAKDLLVVCDDIALPTGKLRIRKSGSSGGHNGLESLVAAAGTVNFPRLRVGIGAVPPGVPQPDYVLSNFTKDQEEAIAWAVKTGADSVICWLMQGIEPAMNKFNSMNPPGTEEKEEEKKTNFDLRRKPDEAKL